MSCGSFNSLKNNSMKKIFALAIASFAMTSIQAQDITDALRYSQTDLNGTARFRAMGGAFGALGGDFSSLNINPAGSVILLTIKLDLRYPITTPRIIPIILVKTPPILKTRST